MTTKLTQPIVDCAGILLTIPKAFFLEYAGGEEAFRQAFEAELNSDGGCWNNIISAVPRYQPLYCYLVFGGKVQYRANIMQFERNTSKHFTDGGRDFWVDNKNWVLLTAPLVKAPTDIPQKGFQGFRYTGKLF